MRAGAAGRARVGPPRAVACPHGASSWRPSNVPSRAYVTHVDPPRRPCVSCPLSGQRWGCRQVA
eukprot:10785910-Lingulodinium_polyedra.AAC.1